MKRSQIKRRPLADTTLNSLEPEAKVYRELDGQGLYFRVKPNGAKSWELRYRKPSGRWSWLGLGGFPSTSGKAARKEAAALRDLASDGVDIAAYKREALGKAQHTFADSAAEWFRRKEEAGRAGSTMRQMRAYFDNDILPVIGKKRLIDVTRGDCARIQGAVEKRGAHDAAKKVRAWMSQVFSQAIAHGHCELNPAGELRHIAATPPKRVHYPHLLESELPAFLKALHASSSRPLAKSAVWLVLRTASRPGMVRYAEWSEIDLEAATWTVPANKMKSRRDHVTPLPQQAVADLEGLGMITGRSRWVFPGQGSRNPVMSENTINKTIALAGYKGKLVGHGSRHTASTLLREHGWPKDHIEVQLAHKEDGIAGVYNQAAYIEQRREMMQWYSDYLDELAATTEQ